jgi:hypothetical protein
MTPPPIGHRWMSLRHLATLSYEPRAATSNTIAAHCAPA